MGRMWGGVGGSGKDWSGMREWEGGSRREGVGLGGSGKEREEVGWSGREWEGEGG